MTTQILTEDSMIYITGDTHGEQSRFLYNEQERKWKEGDYIIVCGDFSYLMLNDRTENSFLNDLSYRPYTLCFVDGNHENFQVINEYPIEEWNGGKIHRIRKNIIHLMRGQVFNIEGKKFFTMGGAYSRDRHMRKLGYSYWDEELPCDSEYKEATANLEYNENSVDYILTHNAPKEIILRMGRIPDQHDIELTGFLEYVMHTVRFRHWYFGHWHVDSDIDDSFSALFFSVKEITE